MTHQIIHRHKNSETFELMFSGGVVFLWVSVSTRCAAVVVESSVFISGKARGQHECRTLQTKGLHLISVNPMN